MILSIESKVLEPTTWEIQLDSSCLQDEDREFIEKWIPAIYHNDLECYLWCFDEKLPSGHWLENIRFSNDMRIAKAIYT